MRELVDHLTAPGIHFVLPRAPENTWYEAKGNAPLTADTRAQIAAAIAQVARDIDEAAGNGAPARRLVIGGFSQGACLTLEYAMERGRWPGAACCLTGFRVGGAGDMRPVSELTDFPVYLSNGARDPFITLPEFAATLEELGQSGARVRCDLFPRQAHVMSRPEIAMFDDMLEAVASGREPFEAAPSGLG